MNVWTPYYYLWAIGMHRWYVPHTKSQKCGRSFHCMTSSGDLHNLMYIIDLHVTYTSPGNPLLLANNVTGLCAGNSPMTGEFPARKASNAENVSIGWRFMIFWNEVSTSAKVMLWNGRVGQHNVTGTANDNIMAMFFTWASYQIHEIAGCACAGNAGNVFPTTAG